MNEAVTWIVENWMVFVWGAAGVLLPLFASGVRRVCTRHPSELAAKLLEKMADAGQWYGSLASRAMSHKTDVLRLTFSLYGNLNHCEVGLKNGELSYFSGNILPQLSRYDQRMLNRAAKSLYKRVAAIARDTTIKNAINYFNSKETTYV